MRYGSISQLGSFTKFTDADADYWFLDASRCTGGDDAPARPTVEPAPGIDGALIFPTLDDAQIITLAGPLIITSAGDESGYLSALDSLFATLKSDINALKAAPGNLVHSGGTLKVWKHAAIDTSWEGITKVVTCSFSVDVFA